MTFGTPTTKDGRRKTSSSSSPRKLLRKFSDLLQRQNITKTTLCASAIIVILILDLFGVCVGSAKPGFKHTIKGDTMGITSSRPSVHTAIQGTSSDSLYGVAYFHSRHKRDVSATNKCDLQPTNESLLLKDKFLSAVDDLTVSVKNLTELSLGKVGLNISYTQLQQQPRVKVGSMHFVTTNSCSMMWDDSNLQDVDTNTAPTGNSGESDKIIKRSSLNYINNNSNNNKASKKQRNSEHSSKNDKKFRAIYHPHPAPRAPASPQEKKPKNVSESICSKFTKRNKNNRLGNMRSTGERLPFCSMFQVANTIDECDEECNLDRLRDLPRINCVRCIDKVLELDRTAYAIFVHFQNVALEHMDCRDNTHWNCAGCEVSDMWQIFFWVRKNILKHL